MIEKLNVLDNSFQRLNHVMTHSIRRTTYYNLQIIKVKIEAMKAGTLQNEHDFDFQFNFHDIKHAISDLGVQNRRSTINTLDKLVFWCFTYNLEVS